MELGVFEFKDREKFFYGSMDYRQIGAIPHFTWYDGCWWSEIRLELPLDWQSNEDSRGISIRPIVIRA